MKKSNTPNAAREQQSNWLAGRTIQCKPEKASQHQNYNLIMMNARLQYHENGRLAAIVYLQKQRPWLIEYCNEENLPASGAILDSLIAQEQKPFTHKLFQPRKRRRSSR